MRPFAAFLASVVLLTSSPFLAPSSAVADSGKPKFCLFSLGLTVAEREEMANLILSSDGTLPSRRAIIDRLNDFCTLNAYPFMTSCILLQEPLQDCLVFFQTARP